MCITPLKGVYISMIKKIAPETDNPATNREAMTVPLRGAKRPKPMKITVSQKTRITSMGVGTEGDSLFVDQPAGFAETIPMLNAWPRSERCTSSFGDNA